MGLPERVWRVSAGVNVALALVFARLRGEDLRLLLPFTDASSLDSSSLLVRLILAIVSKRGQQTSACR